MRSSPNSTDDVRIKINSCVQEIASCAEMAYQSHSGRNGLLIKYLRIHVGMTENDNIVLLHQERAYVEALSSNVQAKIYDSVSETYFAASRGALETFKHLLTFGLKHGISVRTFFDYLDTDCSGYITQNKLLDGLNRIGIKVSTIVSQEIFSMISHSNPELITFNEFEKSIKLNGIHNFDKSEVKNKHIKKEYQSNITRLLTIPDKLNTEKSIQKLEPNLISRHKQIQNIRKFR
jgi:hypothetical protein